MPHSSPIVLGVDPGARQIGVAVFRDEELVFYAVKSFKKRREQETIRKLRKVMEKMITTYRVEFVALEEVVNIQQNKSFVKTVYEEIKDLLKKREIPTFEYHPKLIRQIICRNEKPTKRNIALLLSQKYNELVRYFNVPKLWQKRYFALLFDAIAVGLVCAKELKRKQ
ncbi:MAG: crossover junction endodeoxyribonuclease RuvC [Acidobacteria bacterium]|nr:crossover junction endodeoxyribonuclease RuvC [Acidobacteriota bacterium]MCA1637090.1 crossover junction endodeoxyribonuclease RuvC [Acidobacteriota bacterium]